MSLKENKQFSRMELSTSILAVLYHRLKNTASLWQQITPNNARFCWISRRPEKSRDLQVIKG